MSVVGAVGHLVDIYIYIYLFSSESAAFQRVGGAYVETPLQNWLV